MKQIPAPRDFAGDTLLVKAIRNHSRTVPLSFFRAALAKVPPKPYTLCEQDVGGWFKKIEFCHNQVK
jgi:hypothetical protein